MIRDRSPLRRPTLAAGLLLALAASALAAQTPAVEAARAYTATHQRPILEELVAFLALPNPAGDRDAILRNAGEVRAMLLRRGIASELLESEGSPPAVYGALAVPGATRTIVFYAHYDGQPVDPDRWASPPFQPVLRDGPLEAGGREVALADLGGPTGSEWRLYARSASDDKSPIVAMLTALDALRAAGLAPSVNLKFFFEGEEEAGSPHLGELLRRHADRLAADAWIFCDGPVHQSRRGQVVFGVRGVTDLELTVYGPLRALHSGHYGNWAPNPAVLLVQLLASLRDADGRIGVAGFYDDVRPLSDVARAAVAAIPAPDEALRAELGLAATEADSAPLAERLLLPALNLRGLAAGGVGDAARNAIPTEARASIDFRLVPDQSPARVRQLVEEHIRRQGFTLVTGEPDLATRLAHPRLVRAEWGAGYPAQWTAMDLPVSRAVIAAAEEAWGGELVKIPSLGGSLPLYLFDEILHAPLIVVPMVNHDNSQHGPNENLRLANLWDGVTLYANLMARLGEPW